MVGGRRRPHPRAHLLRGRRGGARSATTAVCGSDPAAPLAEALVATGFAYDPARTRHDRARSLAQLRAPGPRHPTDGRSGARPVLRRSRAGRRLLRGRACATWDLAAGALIAAEAGARLGSLDGGAGPPGLGAGGPPRPLRRAAAAAHVVRRRRHLNRVRRRAAVTARAPRVGDNGRGGYSNSVRRGRPAHPWLGEARARGRGLDGRRGRDRRGRHRQLRPCARPTWC